MVSDSPAGDQVRSRSPAYRRTRPQGWRRARDRRGRGLRGLLVPADVPLSRTRAEQFDDLVLDAVEHLEQRWEAELEGVEFAVEDVPPADELDEAAAATAAGLDADAVPLARMVSAEVAGAGTRGRVVVYRRPVEARALDRLDLADLVLDVVVEQVADLLGLDPDVVDPPED